ncbi:MAG: efflux RND transporter permease subunit [Candidatus Synoicihabitans palmerolidicus]|nr:efflux RND transporter permease subunit [Candidatus Synoicihabitans palmerolidicus]
MFGYSLRKLFQVHPINLSVAVWVGFLALFGIATDDGVIMATYIGQLLHEAPSNTVAAIRERILEAGAKRVRPAMMTIATTVLALLPVLTSPGRGADVMIPMAIPTFGGMMVAIITVFVVPVLYCSLEELRLRFSSHNSPNSKS